MINCNKINIKHTIKNNNKTEMKTYFKIDIIINYKIKLSKILKTVMF